jgi:hypothetical protein
VDIRGECAYLQAFMPSCEVEAEERAGVFEYADYFAYFAFFIYLVLT